jgi:hypothetical protein
MINTGLRKLQSLRARVAIALIGGMLVAGAGFYVLFMTLTRQWLARELDFRAHSLAEHMAQDVSPLLIGDRISLQESCIAGARATWSASIYGLRALRSPRSGHRRSGAVP